MKKLALLLVLLLGVLTINAQIENPAGFEIIQYSRNSISGTVNSNHGSLIYTVDYPSNVVYFRDLSNDTVYTSLLPASLNLEISAGKEIFDIQFSQHFVDTDDEFETIVAYQSAYFYIAIIDNDGNILMKSEVSPLDNYLNSKNFSYFKTISDDNFNYVMFQDNFYKNKVKMNGLPEVNAVYDTISVSLEPDTLLANKVAYLENKVASQDSTVEDLTVKADSLEDNIDKQGIVIDSLLKLEPKIITNVYDTTISNVYDTTITTNIVSEKIIENTTLYQATSLIIKMEDFQNPTGLKSANANAEINIWPNPVNKEEGIKIMMSEGFSGTYSVNLTDMNGSTVYFNNEYLTPDVETSIDLNQLDPNSGIYILTFTNEDTNAQVSKRLIIE